MSNKLYAEILANAVKWAKEAGEIQLSYFRAATLEMTTKSLISDVVTIADKECEQMLRDRVASVYPDHSFIGEEGDDFCGASSFSWVVDPLDGTNNFSQGLPIFCVSIGVKCGDDTVVGVVYVPYLNELFTAVKGEGAFCNGRKLSVSGKTTLAESVLATGFPYDKGINSDNNIENVSRIIPHVRGIRRMGAAAYDLCCVAAGWIDFYWEQCLNPWDICAGVLMVEEAGGEVENFRSNRAIAIVAGNSELKALVVPMLRKDDM